MPSYIARVVLHRTDSSDDYTDLHAEMAKIGFERFVFGTVTKKNYRLPSGTYHFDSMKASNAGKLANIDLAYDGINQAVQTVMQDEKLYIQDANKPPTIFLAVSAETVWAGLQPEPMKLVPRPKS